MLLAVDIGNSATKFGLFETDELTSKFSIPTIRDATADDIKHAVGDRLHSGIESVVVCSVVPDIKDPMTEFLRDTNGVEPLFVTSSFDFGLKIKYEPLESLGTDRLVAAFAAVEKYGAPCIVCSLGTATTIDVVNVDREFLGGVIAPGIDAMAEALHLKTAQLPRVDIGKPSALFGGTTAESIRSGIFHGYVSMVEGLIARFRGRVGDAKVVTTGGNAELIADGYDSVEIIDADLVLTGLVLVSRRLVW